MQGSSFLRPDELWRQVGLAADATVVHLGCGPGFYLIPAAQIIGKKGKAIGVDILPAMLTETESRAERAGVWEQVKTIRANLELPSGSTLEAGSADWVLLANIMHQADPVKLLAEAKRIVKPEGVVVVAEWDTAATPLGPPPAKRVAKTSILEIATGLGLALKREFSPSPYHYGLLLTPR